MPELLTSDVLRNICKPLQLLARTISLTHSPGAAHLLVLVTVTALFSNMGKTQATQSKVA